MLFLFVIGASGVIVGFIVSVVMTLVIVPLYWKKWNNLMQVK